MSETPVKVVLQRGQTTAHGLHGVLLLDGATLCGTLEQPWHDNEHGVSCIPAGVYRCIPHNTPHFPNVWEVTGVYDRAAILIHAGNTTADTHGCILVGLGVSAEGITQSQAALAKLRDTLPQEFTLDVRNASGGL
jgi:hypothetical protein